MMQPDPLHLRPKRNDKIVAIAELLREHDNVQVVWQRTPKNPLLGIRLPGANVTWELPLNRIPHWAEREQFEYNPKQQDEAEYRLLSYLDTY